LVVATVMCLSLAGCSEGLFSDTVQWKGGIFYSPKKHIIQSPTEPMTLKLRPGGTGFAVGIPRGHQRWSDNLCIEVTSEDRYDGVVTWRKASDYDFEITFPGSKYRVSDGPGKFVADWTEVRIYTCESGPEFWSMQLKCAQPGLVVREMPPCRN
jgi:hypothetical protein